ncbi:MAG TPA: zinc-ribbon domain-containing protein, partial [archaeon]|nr:zinc-ribbon domain-containing protein [archaeon]
KSKITMFCPNCGNQRSEEEKFCKQCGQEVK